MKRGQVRVELKNPVSHFAGKEEREREFKKLFTLFKKQCAEAGVLQSCKQHESFESNSRKRRRKKRAAELARLKDKLKENFYERK